MNFYKIKFCPWYQGYCLKIWLPEEGGKTGIMGPDGIHQREDNGGKSSQAVASRQKIVGDSAFRGSLSLLPMHTKSHDACTHACKPHRVLA
jgi:hypothetical protein